MTKHRHGKKVGRKKAGKLKQEAQHRKYKERRDFQNKTGNTKQQTVTRHNNERS